MPPNITTAMILAAGKGTRLHPYTDHTPKPMVEIAGRSIIKRTIDKLKRAGIKRVIVNTHHLAEKLEQHLKDICDITVIFSREDVLLETGGGVKRALPHLGSDPFYLINGDALWEEDENVPALGRLATAWNDASMDCLLLLQPLSSMTLTHGVGDYSLLPDGRAQREKGQQGSHMFAGVRIVHPRVFKDSPDTAFSFLKLMDKAESNNRLYAIAHSGAWFHISTAQDLECVDAAYRINEGLV